MPSCDPTPRLLYQYHDSPLLRSLVIALCAEYCNLQVALDQLETRLDIGLSEGVQLDLIGEIVGQPRPTSIEIDPNELFAFADPPPGANEGLGWSGVGRGDIGGRFTGIDGLFVAKMYDADYRTLLRARIFSNGADGSIDSLIGFLNFALGPGNTVNNRVGEIDLVVVRNLSSVERTIVLSLVPVPAGIRVAELIEPEV